MAIDTERLPSEWNHTLYRGDTWPAYTFTLVDGLGAPISLVGASILMQVKVKATDTEVVKTLTHLDGFVIAANTATFDTEVDLPVGSYVYDLQVTFASGEKRTMYAGKIKIKQDVSA